MEKNKKIIYLLIHSINIQRAYCVPGILGSSCGGEQHDIQALVNLAFEYGRSQDMNIYVIVQVLFSSRQKNIWVRLKKKNTRWYFIQGNQRSHSGDKLEQRKD